MRADVAKWDSKYRARGGVAGGSPDTLLDTQRNLLSGGGRALDLACGVGHNALHLARCGYEVLGVDCSIEGLLIASDAARRLALRVHLLAADLDEFPLPVRAFELVVVFRYLNRGLVSSIARALAPGGLLIYQTFNRNFLREYPGFNRDYVLGPGELASLFPSLAPVETNDTDPGDATSSYLIARAVPR